MSEGPSSEALLRVTDLRAGYRTPVVGPVNFTVEAGEILGFNGPNGAGKSTVMKAIAGGARVFSGSLGRRPGLRVAHQHQNPMPLEDIPVSGRELLQLTGAGEDGLPEWIRPLLGQRLDRLSGGQLQFLQVWACIDAPVDLALLDEPTNNLDRKGIAYLLEELPRRRSKLAMVLISHDRDFLDAVCHRVVEIGQ